MTIKMNQSYWRSVSKALLAVILLSSVACNSLQAAASNDLGEQLITAAREGHLDEVKSLVEQGAEVDKADENGKTPLYWAAQKGHLDVVRFLSPPTAVDLAEWLIASVARERHPDVVKRLADLGADINAADQNGWTPLHYAVRHREAAIRTLAILAKAGNGEQYGEEL